MKRQDDDTGDSKMQAKGEGEMMQVEDLITIPEAMDILGVTRQTLYIEMRTFGVPKFRKTGTRVWIPRKEILRVKEERERPKQING